MAPQNWNNSTATYSSILKLHPAGYLTAAAGALTGRGSIGYYWSNSYVGSTYVTGYALNIGASASGMVGLDKANATPVRCVRDAIVPALPSVSNVSIPTSTMTDSTALGTATVAPDGGAAVTNRGLCWSTTNATPTISNNIVKAGIGIGTFTAKLEGLVQGASYYVRAFATNSVGTAYSPVVSTFKICPTQFDVVHTVGLNGAPEGKTVTYHSISSSISTNALCWLTQNLGADQEAASATDASMVSFQDPLLAKTVDLRDWMNNYVNLYGARATTVALRDSLFALAGKTAIEKAKSGHPLVYGWMVDYFFKGYEGFNIAKGMQMLQPYMEDPRCLTTKRLEIERRLQGIETIRPSVVAPDFTTTDAAGKPVSFLNYKTSSRFKLILFWSADCQHCKEMVAKLYPWYLQVGGKRQMEVFAISVDYTETEVKAWKLLKDKGLTKGKKVIVAGEYYNNKEKYTVQIEQLGLQDDILVHDFFIRDEDVKYYFSAADVVVQPYKDATQSGVTQIAYQFSVPMRYSCIWL